MELSDLHIFRTVVREGGITRAAERLHRVQSNVTTRIRQFEQDLGVDLFVRSGKRLSLSPAGHILLTYADEMLGLADRARAAVQGDTPQGLMRLGSMESTAAVRLPGALAEYGRRFPAVKIELRTGNTEQLATALLASEIDAAYVAEPIAGGPFEKLPVYEEELAIVTARDMDLTGPAGSASHTMLAFEHGCPHRRRLENWFAGRDEIPERIIEMSSYHAILGCVSVGMGIALLPRCVLSALPYADAIRIHDLPPGQDRAQTMLIWRKDVRSANVEALASLYRSEETSQQ